MSEKTLVWNKHSRKSWTLIRPWAAAGFILKTRNKSTAKDKAELHYHELKVLERSGKTYFSHTAKIGVEMYLEECKKDVEAGLIVEGRFSFIRKQLNRWLDIIGQYTKL